MVRIRSRRWLLWLLFLQKRSFGVTATRDADDTLPLVQMVDNFRASVQVAPNGAGVHLGLGVALLRLDQLKHDGGRRQGEAIAALKTAIRLEPGGQYAKDANWKLGTIQRVRGKYKAAIAAHERGLELSVPEGDADLEMEIAHDYHNLGDLEKTTEAARRALAIREWHADALNMLIDIKSETDQDLESVRAMLGLGGSGAPGIGSHAVDCLADRCARPPELESSSARDEAKLLFALFKALDRRKEAPEKIWPYLVCSNRIWRESVLEPRKKYDAEYEQMQEEQLAQVFASEDMFPTWSGYRGSTTAVFVVGMPRCGSTLLERIIDSHPDAQGLGEDTPLSALLPEFMQEWQRAIQSGNMAELQRATQVYGRRIVEHMTEPNRNPRNVSVVVDKMLLNYKHVGFINLLLPNTPIIHSTRGVEDHIFSMFKHRFDDNWPFTYDLRTLAHRWRLYNSTMEHWNRMKPGRVHQHRHEDLVLEPEKQARRALGHLGLPWDESVLSFHTRKRCQPPCTSSLDQVREPVFTHGVGAWKRYEAQLQPLQEYLRMPMPELARSIGALDARCVQQHADEL